jgi:hypothetical protein
MSRSMAHHHRGGVSTDSGGRRRGTIILISLADGDGGDDVALQ